MIYPLVRSACPLRHLLHKVTVGHSQCGKAVQHCATQTTLHRLAHQLAHQRTRPQARTEKNLLAHHGCLGQTATRVAAFLLPTMQAAPSYRPQHLVAWQGRCGTVAMLTNYGARSWWDCCLRPARRNGVPNLPPVVSAITGALPERWLDLSQHIGKSASIGNARFDCHRRHNLARGLIHSQVQLAPRPALARSVLLDLPLALAKNLQAR